MTLYLSLRPTRTQRHRTKPTP